MLMKRKLLPFFFLFVSFLSGVCVSCSRSVSLQAVASPGAKKGKSMPRTVLTPMRMSLDGEEGNTARTTYLLGRAVKNIEREKSASAVFFGEYRTFSNGKKVGQAYLPSDQLHDVYLVSCDADSRVNFGGNLMSGITNGKDYLWSKVLISSCLSDSNAMQVDYSHTTTLLEVVLEGLEQMQLTKPTVWLMPPNDTDITMDLRTGTIGVAKATKEVFEPMSMSEDTGHFLMVPLEDVRQIEVKVMFFDEREGQRGHRCVSGVLSTPMGGFKSGLKYSFVASVCSDGVYFDAPVVSKRKITAESGRLIVQTVIR